MSTINLNVDDGYDLWTTTRDVAWDTPEKLIVLQRQRDYPVLNKWAKNDKDMFQSGTHVTWRVLAKDTGESAFISEFTPNTFNVEDVMVEASCPWIRMTDNYTITLTELLRNMGAEKLVDQRKVRRTTAALRIAATLEKYAWTAPSGPSDVMHPRGVLYHIVPITSSQVGAGSYGVHQGQNPVGFSDWCGIDRSTEANKLTRTYNDVWDVSDGTITEAGVDKILRMQRRLKFTAPTNQKDFDDGLFSNFRQYCGEELFANMERKARLNNDSLGNDLGRFSGEVVVRRVPIKQVEALDGDASFPFIGINHDYFKMLVFENDFFRETDHKPTAALSRLFQTTIDFTYNFACTDPQKAGGIISYVA